MAKFKHKNGGICEVLTNENIVKLRKSSDYKEIKEDKKDDLVIEIKSQENDEQNVKEK